MVPYTLELEQDRARACELVRRLESERILTCVRVRDAVCDGAGRARTRRECEALLERTSLGCALEASVLVKEARIDVQDAVAHNMEAEVPGLDHAGMDRPDRDLVGVVAVYGNGPAIERRIVIE